MLLSTVKDDDHLVAYKIPKLVNTVYLQFVHRRQVYVLPVSVTIICINIPVALGKIYFRCLVYILTDFNN